MSACVSASDAAAAASVNASSSGAHTALTKRPPDRPHAVPIDAALMRKLGAAAPTALIATDAPIGPGTLLANVRVTPRGFGTESNRGSR